MKVTPYVIERFASWLVGGAPFHAMKTIVLSLESNDLSGTEKRHAALEQFQKIGYSLAGFMVDTLLQLALVWVRSKAGKDA